MTHKLILPLKIHLTAFAFDGILSLVVVLRKLEMPAAQGVHAWALFLHFVIYILNQYMSHKQYLLFSKIPKVTVQTLGRKPSSRGTCSPVDGIKKRRTHNRFSVTSRRSSSQYSFAKENGLRD